MKHNVFDTESNGAHLAHSMFTKEVQNDIIKDMKKYGTLKESFLAHKEEMGIEDVIMHGDNDHGIEYSEDVQDHSPCNPEHPQNILRMFRITW